jgi:hypothetical protein
MVRCAQAGRPSLKWTLLPAVLCAGAFVAAPAGHADDSLTVDQRLEQLEADLKAQKAVIASQQQQLLKQQLELQSLNQSDLQNVRGTGTPEGAPAQGATTPAQPPVGVAPVDETRASRRT